ncbi:MAG: hypothetical protein ACRDPK_07700, partial [Carbonactinosporaceae bacterium]
KREWRLFSYGFLGEFLPTGLDVHVWRGERQGHEVTVTVDDVYDAVHHWIRSPLKPTARTGFPPGWRNSGVRRKG